MLSACYLKINTTNYFTYATSSEKSGSESWQYGKYPAKIYTIDGVLIYQVEDGGDNTNKTPKGGVVVQGSNATSMLDAIANPITYYGGSWGIASVINQDGHSGDLYNYYWTSYSRGTDGIWQDPLWHNVYLDGYIPLRIKSIYDPCPYLYRIPSNGTSNQFTYNTGWTQFSYVGGASWNLTNLGESWFVGLGWRRITDSAFEYTGAWGFYYSATVSEQTSGYAFAFSASQIIWPNRNGYSFSYGFPVRCIEDCDPRADATPHSER